MGINLLSIGLCNTSEKGTIDEFNKKIILHYETFIVLHYYSTSGF